MFGFDLEPHWWWLIAGFVLGITELVVPGFFLIWLGIAALATGVVTMVTGIPIPAQLALFALLSVVSMYCGRRWFSTGNIETTDPLLNYRTGRLIGETVTVVEAIDGGSGRVRVGDGVWTARGSDVPVGTRVRITGYDGTILLVEPVA